MLVWFLNNVKFLYLNIYILLIVRYFIFIPCLYAHPRGEREKEGMKKGIAVVCFCFISFDSGTLITSVPMPLHRDVVQFT